MLSTPFLQLEASTFLAVVILVIVIAVVLALYLWWIGWAIFKKPITGAEGLVGKHGIVTIPFSQTGYGEVTVDGIIWRAKADNNAQQSHEATMNSSAGDSVTVIGVSNLTLIVRKINDKA